MKNIKTDKDLKVGDKVDVSSLEKTNFFEDLCSECYIGVNGLDDNIVGKLIVDKPCESHEIANLIYQLGERKSLRVEQWRDKYGAWRVGLNWYGENDFEFICEDSKLLYALQKCLNYLDSKDK